MPGHPAGQVSRCGPPVALCGPSEAWRMPGHRQGGGGAAGFLWPSWAAPGAALEENEVLTLPKPGNILNVAKEW